MLKSLPGDSIDFRYTLLVERVFYTVRHGRYRYKSIAIGVQEINGI
jgi:hypothetical protein